MAEEDDWLFRVSKITCFAIWYLKRLLCNFTIWKMYEMFSISYCDINFHYLIDLIGFIDSLFYSLTIIITHLIMKDSHRAGSTNLAINFVENRKYIIGKVEYLEEEEEKQQNKEKGK